MLLALSQSEATLIAAAAAAGAAILTLLVQLIGTRRAEMRAAHRNALAPYLDELGETIHENLSFSVLIRKRAIAGKCVDDVLANGQRAASDLKAIRRKERYTLAGLEEPLRVVSRLPDWVALQRNLPGEGADRLIQEGKKLQEGIDAAIRHSYRVGAPPGVTRRRVLRWRAERVRALHDRRYDALPPRQSGQLDSDDDPVA